MAFTCDELDQSGCGSPGCRWRNPWRRQSNGRTETEGALMHTKDNLAAELTKAGLTEMAFKATKGWYHDYLSPLAMPCAQLVSDLHRVGTPESRALAVRAMNGEFDANQEEADAWAASPDGKATFRQLVWR
jgi:hypothetical protein